MSRRRPEPDTGSATVWAAGAIASLLVVGALVWALGSAVLTRQRAANAADLAALAAAGHVARGATEACGHAGRIAERMSARLRECRFDEWDALVVVEAPGPGLLAGFGPATARARAGPVDAPATNGRKESN
ncbi:Rv3654c family TadE-like protein [Prauserella cavernicola]|uniref:Flp pilus-assembly TadE/G-like family protein n=1 Tax=Prauserella cavernicola TaxID=2800127 RepID=A0A934QS32_9PSEU|nr:Rv3654c family TadE-like protein [Prauserella cavernicola]MBK1785163.1 flp pilus-assembly TadE/G-like family protein [Prauserella cavernicola]